MHFCWSEFEKKKLAELLSARLFVVAMLLFSCSLISSGCSSAARAADDDGLLIRQERFGEPLTIVMTKNAIKTTLPRHHWTAFAKAPDWRVYMFNSNSKLRYDLSFEDWLRGGVLVRSNDSLDVYSKAKSLKIISSGDLIEAKLKLKRLTYKSFGETISRRYHGLGDVDYVLGVSKKSKAEVAESYSCLYAPGVGNERINLFLYSLNMVPPAKGFPMQYVVNFRGGSKMLRVSTKSISDVKISKDTFSTPKGYKLAATPLEAFVAASQSDLKEMFTDMDIGTPFGTKKAK
ncbi:MAG: hypothetical protein SGJ27_10170 [Candidatus Melainabacteria bacterium]|nr:hypothetical protein [Candidatus Melainabacteria bacterium]